MPALALGIRDIGGTGLFSSEYFVASKFYNNIDFSLGIGWGNLSRQGLNSPLDIFGERFSSRIDSEVGEGGNVSFNSFFSGNIGVFGGAEIRIPHLKNSSLKIEYDSTNYETEGISSGTPYIKNQKTSYSSNWNIGISYKPTNNATFAIASIGAEQFSFNFSYIINLGKKNPILKKEKFKSSIESKENLKKATSLDDRYLYLSALKYLKDEKISLRSLDIKDEKLSIAFSQNTHLSYPRAYGRISRLLDDMSPEKIQYFELISTNTDFELSKVTIPRSSLKKYQQNNLSYLLKEDITLESSFDEQSLHKYKPNVNYPYIFPNISLATSSFLGGPDRFAVLGLGFRADLEILFRRNLTWKNVFSYDLVDSFDVVEQRSDSLLPRVRTDAMFYLKTDNKYTIQRSQLNYFKSISKNIYSKISAGIFEQMFGGIGGEIMYRDFSSNWAVSAELYSVKQREFDQLLRFKRYNTLTGHINLYYNEPSSNILFHLSGGRYLAKDSGFSLNISRRFKSGMRLGAFFSLTDISDEEFGEGSFDKGFYVDFPLEIFFPFHTRELTSFGLRPITRDGAARLIVGYDLYGVTDEGSLYSINRDFGDLYD